MTTEAKMPTMTEPLTEPSIAELTERVREHQRARDAADARRDDLATYRGGNRLTEHQRKIEGQEALEQFYQSDVDQMRATQDLNRAKAAAIVAPVSDEEYAMLVEATQVAESRLADARNRRQGAAEDRRQLENSVRQIEKRISERGYDLTEVRKRIAALKAGGATADLLRGVAVEGPGRR